MENDLVLNASDTPKKQTSLALAIVFSMISFVVAFYITSYKEHGMIIFAVLFENPRLFFDYFARAFGGALLFPILHVTIASFFKSKRNPSSRRNIFIGWSMIVIILQLI